MKAIRAILLFFLFLSLGCATFRGEVENEKTADELIREGMAAFNDKDYKDAIELFEKLKDWYPFSKFASQAELKIADAHFELEEYIDAAFAYDEFEKLHPRNEAIPHVIFRTGLCYFNLTDTIDRDQVSMQKALDTFTRLIREYPKSEEAKKASGYLEICRKSIAEHEFYVGKFYFKGEHYKAALSRFLTIETVFPDTTVYAQAKPLIEKCREKLKQSQD